MTSYRILSIESGPYPSVSILIEAEASKDQLESIAKDIAKEQNVEHVGFVDYEKLKGYGYPLGYWEDGVSYLKEKDWSQRPRQEEVDSYVAWQETLRELRHDSGRGHLYVVVEENETVEATANRLGKTNKEVEEAVTRVTSWIA